MSILSRVGDALDSADRGREETPGRVESVVHLFDEFILIFDLFAHVKCQLEAGSRLKRGPSVGQYIPTWERPLCSWVRRSCCHSRTATGRNPNHWATHSAHWLSIWNNSVSNTKKQQRNYSRIDVPVFGWPFNRSQKEVDLRLVSDI